MENQKIKITFPVENLLALVREAISVRETGSGSERLPLAEDTVRLGRMLAEADRSVRAKIAFLLDPAYPFVDEEEGRLTYRIVPVSRMHAGMAGKIEQALVEVTVCAWFAGTGQQAGNAEVVLEELKGLALKSDCPAERKAVK